MVRTMALQSDGKTILGGSFTNINGVGRMYTARLLPDGTVDPNFWPDPNGVVYGTTIQPDGKPLLVGGFSAVNQVNRSRIARLIPDTAPQTTLTFDGTTIRWIRGGSAPMLASASFEVSTNGIDWIVLGEAACTGEAWEIMATGYPIDSSVRARGIVSGGRYNSSTWITEALLGNAVAEAVVVHRSPQHITERYGANVSLSVDATGSNVRYQWLKDGMPLNGATAAGLVLPFVSKLNEGGYAAIVSNSVNTITSEVAQVTILDPFITGTPANRTNNAGSFITLAGSTIGTSPRAYTWYKDGEPLPGRTNSSISFNGTGADTGGYVLVVTNIYGSATSEVTWVSIIDPYIWTQPPAYKFQHAGNNLFIDI